MKRIKNLIIIGIIVILPIIIFIFNIKIECIFKNVFNIACPGCGLTHAYNELLKLNIVASLKYNILAIPLMLLAVFTVVNLIIDTIKNNNDFFNLINNFFTEHYKLIIIIIIFVFIINNILYILL